MSIHKLHGFHKPRLLSLTDIKLIFSGFAKLELLRSHMIFIMNRGAASPSHFHAVTFIRTLQRVNAHFLVSLLIQKDEGPAGDCGSDGGTDHRPPLPAVPPPAWNCAGTGHGR